MELLILQQILNKLTCLEQGQATMQADISELKQNQAAMRSDITAIKTQQAIDSGSIDDIAVEISKINGKLKMHNFEIESLKATS